MASFKEIIEKNKLVLIDFSAEWCGPCQTLAPILHDLKRDMEDKVVIIKIDVDKNPGLASNFKVQGVPTMVLFDGGKQVWRQSGLLTKAELTKVIDQYA